MVGVMMAPPTVQLGDITTDASHGTDIIHLSGDSLNWRFPNLTRRNNIHISGDYFSKGYYLMKKQRLNIFSTRNASCVN